MRLSIGLEVGFHKVHYIQGIPHRYFEIGTVQIVRKDTVVVRVRFGYEREVPKENLLVRNKNKPRRDMRGWVPLT